MRLVSQVEQIFARQLLADGLQHRKTANAGVEDADKGARGDGHGDV
jgi:hypothetical protein